MKDKELTKRKLIKAVGDVINAEGFQNLKISKVSKYANMANACSFCLTGNE